MDVYERCEQKLDTALAQCDVVAKQMRELRRFSHHAFLLLMFTVAAETLALTVVIYFAIIHVAKVQVP